jgi:hypothetical protein
MSEFREIEQFAVGTFHRFGFGWLAAAAIRIAGPTHVYLQDAVFLIYYRYLFHEGQFTRFNYQGENKTSDCKTDLTCKRQFFCYVI